MNFFGHAALACRKSTVPAFVLGSMLPDFWGMIRARAPTVSHAELASGIAFHHLSDTAFHDAMTFRELTRAAVASLLALGMERGRARAVAHVGIEILLDRDLASEEHARRAYVTGLEAASPDALGRFIAWRDGNESRRFDELCLRLAARGVAADDASPSLVAFRLERALAGRRRLALTATDVELVRLWAADAAPLVTRRADALMAEVESELTRVRHRPTP